MITSVHFRISTIGCVLSLAAAPLLAPPSAATGPMVTPKVINGQSGHPWSGASVYFEAGEGDEVSACTGGLWKPQIIVTAAHCVMDTRESPVTDQAFVTVWPPGANTDSVGPADVQVTSILVDWSEDDGLETSDIAFLTLSAPIGSTPISRLASKQEVADVIRSEGMLTYIGYGLTVPRNDPSGASSSVPLWLTEPMDDEFDDVDIEVGQFTTLGDGISSTCAGDSGGPYLYEVSGEILLVGPLSGGSGRPCEDEDDIQQNRGTTTAAHLSLANQALATVGLPPETSPAPRLELSRAQRYFGTKVSKATITDQGLFSATIRTPLKKGSPIWVDVYSCDTSDCDDWTSTFEKKYRVKKGGRVTFTAPATAGQYVSVWDKEDDLLVQWQVLEQ